VNIIKATLLVRPWVIRLYIGTLKSYYPDC